MTSLLQREIKCLECLLERSSICLFLFLRLHPILPIHPVLQLHQFRHHPPPELNIETEFRPEGEEERVLRSFGGCGTVRAFGGLGFRLRGGWGLPDPQAEEIARFAAGVGGCGGTLKSGIAEVLGLDFEGGIDETAFD